MRSLLILLLALSVSSCAVMQVAERPETLAVCEAADVLTTAYAVSAGIGREVNPILAGSVNSHSWLSFIATKVGLVALVWWIYDNWPEQTKYGVAAGSAITCGVAAHNTWMLLK